MKEFYTKSKVILMSLMCALTLLCILAYPLTTHASDSVPGASKLPPRLIGVFDYTYEDGVGHFEGKNKDYVVLYELRTPALDNAKMKFNYPFYNSLYIYPVTKDSFQKYWENDGKDPSLLEMYNSKYTFNNPSTEIYPKPSDKVISSGQAISEFGLNVVGGLQRVFSCRDGYTPAMNIYNLYLKDGLTAIPDFFLDDYRVFNISTLTSNNLEDSEEGLPDSIESIGAFAFSGSHNSFDSLPTNLKTVKTHAFEDCSLTVKHLPADAVFERDSLHGASIYQTVYIDVDKHFPKGMTDVTIGVGGPTDETTLKANKLYDRLFENCRIFSDIKLVTKAKTIPELCFCRCRNITMLSISKNVKKIDKEAFYFCDTVSYKGTPRFKKLFKDAENSIDSKYDTTYDRFGEIVSVPVKS